LENQPTPVALPAEEKPLTLAFLQAAFEAAPIGIAISGPDLRFRMVNPKLADWLGYTREELIGKSFQSVTHPEDVAVSDKLAEELANGNPTPSTIHKRYIQKSGRVVWASLATRSIVDPDTGERITIALIQDVSGQRRTEELTRALSEQTSRLAAIIQKSPLAVILTNEDGGMTYLNRAALEMLGLSEAIGALGQSIELVDAGVDGERTTILDDLRSSGRWHGERFFRSLDGGELLAVHVTAFRLDRQQSGVGSLAFVVKDIRERKKIELALREREDRLSHLARRLIRAQEEERARIARDLHDDVTQRLALMAVEIGFLQSNPETSEQALSQKLEELRLQVVELTDTVRDLSHHYHPSALTHSSLGGALESLCYEFESRHGIQTRYRGDAQTDGVSRSIATAIYRIVQEGLQNVARHAGASRVVLTLAREADELRVALLDDGAGFNPDTLRQRAGLGLTSMEERAHAIGGVLRIFSEPGSGTRIELSAPVVEAPEGEESP
jgi:PAS domain S-box-containing protein